MKQVVGRPSHVSDSKQELQHLHGGRKGRQWWAGGTGGQGQQWWGRCWGAQKGLAVAVWRPQQNSPATEAWSGQGSAVLRALASRWQALNRASMCAATRRGGRATPSALVPGYLEALGRCACTQQQIG